MIVEDSEDTATAVADILGVEHEVRWAGDGDEALACAVGFVPEFVFVDIGLPGISGFEVARRLRNLFGQSVRLIAFTGNAVDAAHAKAAGFDDLIQKPAAMDRLLSAATPRAETPQSD